MHFLFHILVVFLTYTQQRDAIKPSVFFLRFVFHLKMNPVVV